MTTNDQPDRKLPNGFPASVRLRNSAEYDRVYKQKRSVADDLFVVYAAANGLAYSRLGRSVSRRVGNAVVRNRWKRVLREAFRQQYERIPTGYDFVVVPRRGTDPRGPRIWDALPKLAVRAARKAERGNP